MLQAGIPRLTPLIPKNQFRSLPAILRRNTSITGAGCSKALRGLLFTLRLSRLFAGLWVHSVHRGDSVQVVDSFNTSELTRQGIWLP